MDPATNLFRTLQELRGAPLTTLFALLAVQHRVGISSLARKIGFNRATVRTALLFLLERGFVARDQAGEWAATQAAGALLAGLSARSASTAVPIPDQPAQTCNPMAEGPAGGENNSPVAEGPDQNLSSLLDNFPPTAGGGDQKLSSCAGNFSPTARKNQAVKNLYPKIKKKELKQEDPELNLTGPDIEQHVSPHDPSSPQMDVSRILAATGKLFGEWVLGRPQQYPDARLLLGTIAAAYDNRRRLERPARVVYANLKAGRFPAKQYLEKPQAYLPADFCRAAGLPLPARPYDDWSQNLEPLAEPKPKPELEVEWPPVEPEALEWFRKLMSFDKELSGWTIHHQYLEECDLISCDLQAGEFVISAKDQLCADWLNGRLSQKLQNDLVGIAGRRLNVRFEVWPPLGDAG